MGGGPAVLLSVHSTGKGGRLGSAALHMNVGSLPGVSSPRAIHDLQLPWEQSRIDRAKSVLSVSKRLSNLPSTPAGKNRGDWGAAGCLAVLSSAHSAGKGGRLGVCIRMKGEFPESNS